MYVLAAYMCHRIMRMCVLALVEQIKRKLSSTQGFFVI